MEIKTFKFEDHSQITFELSDAGELSISLQARHLGKDFKITSANAFLDKGAVDELINWMADSLAPQEQNDE